MTAAPAAVPPLCRASWRAVTSCRVVSWSTRSRTVEADDRLAGGEGVDAVGAAADLAAEALVGVVVPPAAGSSRCSRCSLSRRRPPTTFRQFLESQRVDPEPAENRGDCGTAPVRTGDRSPCATTLPSARPLSPSHAPDLTDRHIHVTRGLFLCQRFRFP
jgi:hypothetical protein